ncbi:helix-turn-helix transcriptional regulator [uncultured Pseudacidovorax sp.]|uniref:helix-turn-helix domain-containing protein n=1 Tax=uncultured Pseudacidovorax sp. TaxID=679313 RepID=UPI0025DD9D3E|nr:helix-turn-helix transcriptional regulator [uncultured Pseudacidovorax sp.]
MGTNVPICKVFMGSIGDRLREERERLGLSQSEFAAKAGTTRKTQFNYETDARRPDADYLAALLGAGVDVLYVLSGQRGIEGVAQRTLRPDQEALLDNYEHADDVGRQAAQRLLDPQSQRKKA